MAELRTLTCLLAASAGLACHSGPSEHMSDALVAVTTKSEELIEEGDAALASRDHAAALSLYNQAVTQAVTERRRDNQVEALANYARVHLLLGHPNRSAIHVEKASERADPEAPNSWSRFLLARSLYESANGETDSAIDTLESLYQYCIEQQMPERAIEACHHASLIDSADNSVGWSWLAIDLAEDLDNDKWLATLLNNLGWTYDELGAAQEALDTFLAARRYQDRVGGDQERLVADYAVGHCYRMLDDREEAQRWLTRSFRWAESRYLQLPSPTNARWLGMLHWEVGELAAIQGELISARDHLDQASIYLDEADISSWWQPGAERLTRRRQQLEKLIERLMKR